MQNRQKDKESKNFAQNNKGDFSQNFHGTDEKYSLIYKNRKIVIRKQLEICTELNIPQHFYWKNLRKTVHKTHAKCKTCQFLKRNKKQYGKPPPKDVETFIWDTLCVDLIGKYQFTSKGGRKKFKTYQRERK